jgi:hypothetical protein
MLVQQQASVTNLDLIKSCRESSHRMALACSVPGHRIHVSEHLGGMISPDPDFQKRLQLGEQMAEFLRETLTAAPSVKSYAQLYTRGMALQFHSNLQAVLSLLSQGLDSEAWIIGRSMGELVIRVKWVHRRKSNAVWMILGTEQADLNRFSAYKGRRSRVHQAAIDAIQQRLAILPALSKKGRFWQKTQPGKVRRLPSIEAMAKEGGMVRFYRGFFKWGSEHTHASHRVLERFMVLDAQGRFTGRFVLVPPDNDLSLASHHLLVVVVIFLGFLRKYGVPLVDENRFVSMSQSLLSIRPATAFTIRG